MSNPFRRSSLAKGAVGINSFNTSPGPRGTEPLAIDTKVRATSQKHVNFASPPAIISPVSYASSPESTRQEFPSAFSSPNSSFPAPTDYSQAFASDPFAEQPDGEDDSAIEKAQENAKFNTAVVVDTTATVNVSKVDPVKDTLGRFSSGVRKPSTTQEFAAGAMDQGGSMKPTMDVDAFKRMLLTGERQSAASRGGVTQNAHTTTIQPVSDSSSNADSASISQHSLFETVPHTHEESPRTSEELDTREANEPRATPVPSSSVRRPPPPPKSRHGKPDKEATPQTGSIAKLDNFINSLTLTTSQSASSETASIPSPSIDQSPTSDRFAKPTVPESNKRTAPALPLARRKSQQPPSKPVLRRDSSSRQSVQGGFDLPPSPSAMTSTSKGPPPPPARRSTSTGERRPSLDVISVSETDSLSGQQITSDWSSVEAGPALTQIPSYLKRTSQAPPPPPPPPRRGRGSSRSSVDTQRPTMTALGMREISQGESNINRGSTGSRDILADLAALQREVDAARASAGP
ncbi:hypothetical protein LTR67_003432 [Exophiala xenobiotica]